MYQMTQKKRSKKRLAKSKKYQKIIKKVKRKSIKKV